MKISNALTLIEEQYWNIDVLTTQLTSYWRMEPVLSERGLLPWQIYIFTPNMAK